MKVKQFMLINGEKFTWLHILMTYVCYNIVLQIWTRSVEERVLCCKSVKWISLGSADAGKM